MSIVKATNTSDTLAAAGSEASRTPLLRGRAQNPAVKGDNSTDSNLSQPSVAAYSQGYQWQTWSCKNCYTDTDWGKDVYYGGTNMGGSRGWMSLWSCQQTCLNEVGCECVTYGTNSECYLRTYCQQAQCVSGGCDWTTYWIGGHRR